MDILIAENLKQSLQNIRKAAQALGLHGWSSAKSLYDTIESELPQLASQHELPAKVQAMRREIHQRCISWQSSYRLIVSHADHDVYEAAFQSARLLVGRIDAMVSAIEGGPRLGA